jgi:hypothetical protein
MKIASPGGDVAHQLVSGAFEAPPTSLATIASAVGARPPKHSGRIPYGFAEREQPVAGDQRDHRVRAA